MATEQTVIIQYIGKKPSKTDTVRPGSGRFWKHPGDVVIMPEREKFSYVGHGDIWRELTQKQYEQELAAADEAVVTPIIAAIKGFSDINIKRLSDAVGAELKLRSAFKAPSAPRQLVPTKNTVADISKSSDLASIAAFNERVKLVANAIQAIDLRDDLLAENGWPKAEALQGMVGALPTEDEIGAAMELLGLEATPPFGSRDEGSGGDEGGNGSAEDDPELAAAKAAARERAQLALGEVDAANRDTLKEMIGAFDIKGIAGNASTDKMRVGVRDALTALAIG